MYLHNWKYTPDFRKKYREPGYDDSSWENVQLPHSNRELPFNVFNEKDYQFISCYRTSFSWNKSMKNKRVFIDFEGVMIACTIWVNGTLAGEHRGGYTPFSIECTSMLNQKSNVITVMVDSTERNDIPPHGGVVDYLTYGGIYREVSLRTENQVYINDLFPHAQDVLSRRPGLVAEVTLSEGTSTGPATILLELFDDNDEHMASKELKITLDGMKSHHAMELEGLENISLWDLDSPVLYRVRATLMTGNKGSDPSVYEKTFGFREARFTEKGFYLNGRPVKLRGLNRHQSYPYVGYAMPSRAQQKDAEILKNELGCTMVRTSHYPQSRHFLDKCDQIGLMVFQELPGWQHVGDQQWKDQALQEMEEMIMTDRHRPSIVLWGTRINESQDDHDFYTRTNTRCRELDPTRQTGGVRFLEKSELLEDVYTINDFFHRGNNPGLRKPRRVTGLWKPVPYLVTEHNGHMFPTKRYDNEHRVVEHALRHARVLDHAYGDNSISGALGWCMADYNTHSDFGSGDRVCYHGVLDMFREPKYAAWIYASQQDPGKKVVMHPATLMANGERDAASSVPLYVFTNCDSIRVYENHELISEWFPDRKTYPHLPHPPVTITELIGNRLETREGISKTGSDLFKYVMMYGLQHGFDNLKLRHKLAMGLFMVRFRKNFADLYHLFGTYVEGWGVEQRLITFTGVYQGKEVIHRSYGSGQAYTLSLEPDDTVLHSQPWDTTRVVVRVTDEHGNQNPFMRDTVKVNIEGPASIIGPSTHSLIGGSTAFWIRTGKGTGKVAITATIDRAGTTLKNSTTVTVKSSPAS